MYFDFRADESPFGWGTELEYGSIGGAVLWDLGNGLR